MKIERIELRTIEMELIAPFETSFGRFHKRPIILVKLFDDGVVGWGECVAGEGPWYSYETAGTAWHILREFAIPMILHQPLDHPSAVWERLRPIRGHNMAKAALEMAAWDLWARQQGVSLSKALGGTRTEVASGVSIGLQKTDERLLDVIADFLAQGYQRIKLKIKPGRDVAMVRAVRERFPEVPLQVDANSAYTLDDAPQLQALDDFNLLLIEQPLGYDDIVDHAKLQAALKTPICLDESIHSPDDARHALDLGSCRVINIKPGRVGGFTQSIAIHDLCQAREIPVWCGGMLESGVGRAHNVALASLPNFRLPGDISASDRYWHADIVDPPFTLQANGTIRVPDGPGIGVQVLEDRLSDLTTAFEAFS